MENTEARLAVETIVANSTDAMFEKFDMLHKRGINDDDVARALRDLGHNALAVSYLAWQNDGEPLREDEDGPLDQGEHLVTDPGDMPSYFELEAAILSAYKEKVEAATKAIIAELVNQRETYTDGPYVDDSQDPAEMMIDGYVNIPAIVTAVIKALA